jgi:hypothetical protein
MVQGRQALAQPHRNVEHGWSEVQLQQIIFKSSSGAVESSTRTMGQPDVIVIDGCAMLWVIHYPSNGTVLDFCKAVSSYVLRRMLESDVFVVFDRYFDFSIKSCTRVSHKNGER